jgi:hypothetical protein
VNTLFDIQVLIFTHSYAEYLYFLLFFSNNISLSLFRYALRAGIWVEISSEELVPGDVVSLKAPAPKKPRKKRSKLTLFSSFFEEN